MDQRNTELGADQCQVVGAVGGPVIDIEALWKTPTQDRLLEDRQERLGVLG